MDYTFYIKPQDIKQAVDLLLAYMKAYHIDLFNWSYTTKVSDDGVLTFYFTRIQ